MSNKYTGLRRLKKEEAKRCANRLLAIRQRLEPLRKRKGDGTLLLATWNIRDFDSNKFGYGPRLPETFYYIAEMISCFDLVAVQEVSRDLAALQKVMGILGREWDFIATDTTARELGGNDERMVFVYNTEKVWFRKIAGEIVLPEGQVVVSRENIGSSREGNFGAASIEGLEAAKEAGLKEAHQQFARTPFLVAFQSGWFKFSLCTVHIYYGKSSGPALQRRIREIRRLVKFFADRQDKASRQERDELGGVENYILLGDFNVVSPKHETMDALKSEGFAVPNPIDGDAVRKKGKHFYDQIAVRVKDPRFKVVTGGMIDMFQDVFRESDEDRAIYAKVVPESDPEENEEFRAETSDAIYRKWRTWQMSDHDPLWIEIATDYADDYLERLATGAR